MPTVPSRRIQTVGAAGVQPVFKRATAATAAAFGGAAAAGLQSEAEALKAAASGKLSEAVSTQVAGAARGRGLQELGAGLTQAGDALGDILLKRQIEDNEREAKDLDYKYSVALRSAGHGDGTEQNPGFYSTRGQNSVDTRKATEEAISKTRSALLETASNNRVKDMFNQASLIRTESELVTIARHTTAQAKVANDNVSDARISSAISDAILDPWGKTKFASETIASETQSKAENNGWSKEVQEEERQKATDSLAMKVVDGLLSTNDIEGAKKLLKSSTKDIGGEAQVAIRENITRHENQRLVTLTVQAKNAIDIWDAGKQPEPAALAALSAELNNLTSPRSKAIKTAMKVAQKDYIVVHDHNKQPLPVQLAANAALDAIETPTDEQFRQLGKMQKATATLRKNIADGNGMAAASEAGMINPISPVNMLDPGSIQVRSAQHDAAMAALGVPISPLNKAETDEAVRLISGEPNAAGEEPAIADSVSALNNLVGVLGPDKAAFVANEVVTDAPEVAAVMTISLARPDLARDILAGGRFARKNPNVAVTKATRVAELDAIMGNAFPADIAPGARAAYGAAADGYYALLKSKSGDLEEDASLYRQAVEAVTGGMISRNGQVFQSPVHGMSTNRVNDLLDRITDQKLLKHGNGQPVFADGTPFTANNLDDARLRTSGPGRVAIDMPGSGPIVNSDGRLYELDLKGYNASGTASTDPRRVKRVAPKPASFGGGLGELFRRTQDFDKARLEGRTKPKRRRRLVKKKKK